MSSQVGLLRRAQVFLYGLGVAKTDDGGLILSDYLYNETRRAEIREAAVKWGKVVTFLKSERR